MKPYTKTITGEESSAIYQALQHARYYTKQCVQQKMPGADHHLALIENAIKIANRPCEGGYETDEELTAAWRKKAYAEFEKYGCE